MFNAKSIGLSPSALRCVDKTSLGDLLYKTLRDGASATVELSPITFSRSTTPWAMASGDAHSPCYHAPRTLTSEKLSASGDATAVTSSHSRRLLLTGRFSATVARRKTPWCGGQPEHLVSSHVAAPHAVAALSPRLPCKNSTRKTASFVPSSDETADRRSDWAVY